MNDRIEAFMTKYGNVLGTLNIIDDLHVTYEIDKNSTVNNSRV